MNKYLFLIFLFSIFISGCARHNRIDFSSSEAFFSSLNEKKIIDKENISSSSKLGDLEKSRIENTKKNKVNNTKKQISKKPLLLTLSFYEKQLKQKIGFDEFLILKIFNNPSLKIKHGKTKNFQFHLNSCHLDLFFLNDGTKYKFIHFDIRPSSILSNLNKKNCVEELNNKFILIHDPK